MFSVFRVAQKLPSHSTNSPDQSEHKKTAGSTLTADPYPPLSIPVLTLYGTRAYSTRYRELRVL